MPILYIVATPIGNLEDISFRALRVLREVDLILCEDTRVTKKLLAKYALAKPLISYHQHSRLQKVNYILEQLKAGKKMALVSDAGTPGISDPGNQLIGHIKNRVTKFLSNQVTITPIPGPSALTAALSISGLPADKFVFLGFPPQKKKRKKFFQDLAEQKLTAIFYESPYRIVKSLSQLSQLSKLSNRQIVVCRELTKKFESIYRGNVEEVLEQVKKDRVKGEYVVIVAPPSMKQ